MVVPVSPAPRARIAVLNSSRPDPAHKKKRNASRLEPVIEGRFKNHLAWAAWRAPLEQSLMECIGSGTRLS